LEHALAAARAESLANLHASVLDEMTGEALQ
jgi:hypothetical protein